MNAIPGQYLELLACPVCHAAVHDLGQTLACSVCGRTFLVDGGIPIMLPWEQPDSALQRTLAAWNRAWSEQGLPLDGNIEADPAYADSLRHIREHAPKKWGVFLEAGCGSGRKALVVAREKKVPVIGVDGCVEACRLARQLFAREGEEGFFIVGDLRHLPLRANAIGYAFAGGSLEHFPETSAGVAEIHRVLEPGGRITATVPCLSLASLTYAQLWGNIPDAPLLRPWFEFIHLFLLGGRHMRYGYEKSFTRPGWMRYFRQAGFRNLVCAPFATHSEFRFLPWPWLKAMARRLVQHRWFWPVLYLDGDK